MVEKPDLYEVVFLLSRPTAFVVQANSHQEAVGKANEIRKSSPAVKDAISRLLHSRKITDDKTPDHSN